MDAGEDKWEMSVDESFSSQGSGAGVVLNNGEGEEVLLALRFSFEATNNEAEYEAILAGLRLCMVMGIQNVIIRSDSQLAVQQLKGEFQARVPGMVAYLSEVKRLL